MKSGCQILPFIAHFRDYFCGWSWKIDFPFSNGGLAVTQQSFIYNKIIVFRKKLIKVKEMCTFSRVALDCFQKILLARQR